MNSEVSHYRMRLVDSLSEIGQENWDVYCNYKSELIRFYRMLFWTLYTNQAQPRQPLDGRHDSSAFGKKINSLLQCPSMKKPIPMVSMFSTGHGQMPIINMAYRITPNYYPRFPSHRFKEIVY